MIIVSDTLIFDQLFAPFCSCGNLVIISSSGK